MVRDRKIERERSRYVSGVAKGILALPSRPLVEAVVDVDRWRYRYYGARTYVENCCALPTKYLSS